MSTNYVVSSFVSSVNNAGAVNKPIVDFPYSKIIEGILKILLDEGFISHYEVYEKRQNIRYIKIHMKYVKGKCSVQDFKVVSKPGKRIYSSPKLLRPHYDSLGHYVFSTSKGIMTDHSARHLNIGGEVLCKIF
jgi:small subunit ribosomal protein S8